MTDSTKDKSRGDAPAGAPDLEKLSEINQLVIRTLGEAVSLMVPLDKYQQTTVADLRARVLPAIILRQCRLFRHKGFPIAFVSWALLSDEAEQRLREEPSRIGPKDWRSGSRLTFIDVVSPKGREEEIKDVVRRDLAGVSANGAAPSQKADS